LLSKGQPQKYGTQYEQSGDAFILSAVDPATTDAERAEWDVPPLHAAHEMAKHMGDPRGSLEALLEDPPLAALQARGLRVEIKRWLGPEPPPDRPKPQPSPLSSSDPISMLPLPGHARAARLAGAYCATNSSGDVLATWRSLPLEDGVFVNGWPKSAGPPPVLEELHVDNASAVSMSATNACPEQIVIRRGDAPTCWLVSNTSMSHDELVQLARSLLPPK
jgi:hypothetical protein